MTLLSSQAFIWWESAWLLVQILGLLTCLMDPWVTEMLLCNGCCSWMHSTQMLVCRAPNAWRNSHRGFLLTWYLLPVFQASCPLAQPVWCYLPPFTPPPSFPHIFPSPIRGKHSHPVSPPPAAIPWQCPTNSHYHPGPSNLYAYHLQSLGFPAVSG